MTVLTAPQRRLRRRRRVRAKIQGTGSRPRISVFRSNRGIFAQLIDDDAGRTVLAVDSRSKEFRARQPQGGNVTAAKLVGEMLAGKAKAQGIERVVFDRGGYMYHGRVKALADAARAGGLVF